MLLGEQSDEPESEQVTRSLWDGKGGGSLSFDSCLLSLLSGGSRESRGPIPFSAASAPSC